MFTTKTEASKPLLKDEEKAGANAPKANTDITPKAAQPSVSTRVISAGIANLLISVNLIANSYMLKHDGHDGAGSLTTTFQAVLLGICAGSLFAIPQKLGKPVGRGDFEEASEVIKAAYTMTGISTAVSTAGYGLTNVIFPHIANAETAKAASSYFTRALIGNWPASALVTTGLIAFQGGNWLPMLLSTVGFRGISTVAAVLAGLKHGVSGIGFANGIAPWPSYIAMQTFLNLNYPQFKQPTSYRDSISKHLGPLLVLGSKFAAQRLTEWGNLAIITSYLGHKSEDALPILNLPLQVITLFSLFSQGAGMGGMMMNTIRRSGMNKAIEEIRKIKDGEESATQSKDVYLAQLATIKDSQNHLKSTSKKCLLIGLLLNAALAISLYAAREPLTDIFIENNSPIRPTAETALWLTGVNLLPDGDRIISGTLLNSYEKPMFQNYVSGGVMTVLGITIGAMIGELTDANPIIAMLAVRAVAILASMLLNINELNRSINKDQARIDDVSEWLNSESSDASFHHTASSFRELSSAGTTAKVKNIKDNESPDNHV